MLWEIATDFASVDASQFDVVALDYKGRPSCGAAPYGLGVLDLEVGRSRLVGATNAPVVIAPA